MNSLVLDAFENDKQHYQMLYLLSLLTQIFNIVLFVILMAISIDNYFMFVVVVSLVGIFQLIFNDYSVFMVVIFVSLIGDIFTDY